MLPPKQRKTSSKERRGKCNRRGDLSSGLIKEHLIAIDVEEVFRAAGIAGDDIDLDLEDLL